MMFVVHGVDPRGDIESVPGEFKDLIEAMSHIAGAVQFMFTSLELSGMDPEMVSGHDWMGIKDKESGMVWKYVAVEIPDKPGPAN